MQVITTLLLADEVHVDQAVQHRGGVHGRDVRLQQVVHRDRRDGAGVDGQGLHHQLGRAVQAAEGLAHQRLDHRLRQRIGGPRQQFLQGRAAIGRQGAVERLQRPRKSARPLADVAEHRVVGRLQPDHAVGVQLAQDVLRVRRIEPFVQRQRPLPLRLDQRQIAGRNAGRDQDLDRVVRRVQDRPQGLLQVVVSQRARAGVEQLFQVVQQHHHGLSLEMLQQRQQLVPRRCFGVAVQRVQAAGHLVGQQPAQIGVQVGHVDRVGPDLAQIHDPVHGQRSQVVGQAAALQRPEQPADHGRLAHAAAAGDGHQPLGIVPQEVGDQLGLDEAVLEVGRRDHGRRVDELGARPAAHGFGRLPLGFDPRGNALLDAGRRRGRVADDGLQACDLVLEFLHFPFDPRPVVLAGALQVARGVGQPLAQHVQPPFVGVQILQVPAQAGQAGIEVGGEVDVLPRAQPERQFGIAVGADQRQGLLELQRPDPFVLADGGVFHAVGRHDEDQAVATADRLIDLRVPIAVRLQPPRVQPRAKRRRPRFERVGQLEGELVPVGRGVADEVVHEVLSPESRTDGFQDNRFKR